MLELQGKLVSKLTLGPLLTMTIRIFQAYLSLNPSRVKQNYNIHLLEMAKTID